MEPPKRPNTLTLINNEELKLGLIFYTDKPKWQESCKMFIGKTLPRPPYGFVPAAIIKYRSGAIRRRTITGAIETISGWHADVAFAKLDVINVGVKFTKRALFGTTKQHELAIETVFRSRIMIDIWHNMCIKYRDHYLPLQNENSTSRSY